MRAAVGRAPADQADLANDLGELDAMVRGCRACPRLVAWREEIGVTRRAAFRDQEYWAQPLSGFGPADASIAIFGLAPAAHGGNRTGRMFTGDRSGDVLFAALHRAGLANQSTSVAVDDGLVIRGARILAAVRCAPPANRPSPAERDQCAAWSRREFALMKPTLRAVVVLGGFAWDAFFPIFRAVYGVAPVPRPRFGHGAEYLPGDPTAPAVVGCYHVSQQNTFTGRLTTDMLDATFARAKHLAGLE
jgi:uracil-DNA glycosylase family 4